MRRHSEGDGSAASFLGPLQHRWLPRPGAPIYCLKPGAPFPLKNCIVCCVSSSSSRCFLCLSMSVPILEYAPRFRLVPTKRHLQLQLANAILSVLVVMWLSSEEEVCPVQEPWTAYQHYTGEQKPFMIKNAHCESAGLSAKKLFNIMFRCGSACDPLASLVPASLR